MPNGKQKNKYDDNDDDNDDESGSNNNNNNNNNDDKNRSVYPRWDNVAFFIDSNNAKDSIGDGTDDADICNRANDDDVDDGADGCGKPNSTIDGFCPGKKHNAS